jgi:sulfur carrier protein ThiS
MAAVLFNAFSFLQKELKAQDRPFNNALVQIEEGATVSDLLATLGLDDHRIEAVFVNGTVQPFDTVLRDGDRVAVVPPGTPGPYRVLLGMKRQKRNR